MDATLVLELIASALTIWQIKLYGDVDHLGPVVGVASSMVWAVLLVVGGQSGLWPLIIFSFIMHIRNWRLWHGK